MRPDAPAAPDPSGRKPTSQRDQLLLSSHRCSSWAADPARLHGQPDCPWHPAAPARLWRPSRSAAAARWRRGARHQPHWRLCNCHGKAGRGRGGGGRGRSRGQGGGGQWQRRGDAHACPAEEAAVKQDIRPGRLPCMSFGALYSCQFCMVSSYGQSPAFASRACCVKSSKRHGAGGCLGHTSAQKPV